MAKLKTPKIFVIGLSRTGTTSMCGALEFLGYRVLHYPDTKDVIHKTLAGRFDWDVLDEYDAFADGAPAAFYRELDKQCPGSKFILLTRDEEPWLKSCKMKIKNKHTSAKESAWEHTFVYVLRACLYNRHYFDEVAFSRARRRHTEDVRRHFRKRKGDLLVMDIKEGWEPLCEFLGVPIPLRQTGPPVKFPSYKKAPKVRFR